MTIAKVFRNGRSQAIRLPKEFRVDTNEVYLSGRARASWSFRATRGSCFLRASRRCPRTL